jgi:phage tail-like protein
MADVRPEFVHANQFTFSIDGVIQEGVHKIEGLRQTVDVHRHIAGNQRYEQIQAGRLQPFDLTIVRDYSATDELHQWADLAALPQAGKDYRRTIAIGLLDRSGTTVGTYECYGCLPKENSFSDLRGDKGEHLQETMVITVEKMLYKPA